MLKKPLLISVIIVALSSQRSFVDTAPTPQPQKGSPEMVPETLDANVKELESLKQSIGKTLQMMKSHSTVYTNVNGHKEGHSDSTSELKEDGNLVARIGQHVDKVNGGPAIDAGQIRTDVDIPGKGIHKSLLKQLVPDYQQFTENGNRRTPGYDDALQTNSLEKYVSLGNTQYSPLDMAEYVFWTGDEKGVTLAIEEFLQEGLMSREEAISFLQEIKYNLDYLQSHYTQLGLNARDRTKENTPLKPLGNPRQTLERTELKNNFDITRLREQTKKNVDRTYTKDEEKSASKSIQQQQMQQNDEYDELLERLRVADFLYTEYSLEEVIYQLAKVMFTQSLTRGSSEAQQALQKFTTFLETEADQGHISRSLEKKVLDVLIAALTDTLNEHPDLSSENVMGLHMQSHSDRQNILRQILQMSPDDKAAVEAALSPYKDQSRSSLDLQSLRNPVDIELKDKSHLPLSLTKYKTIR